MNVDISIIIPVFNGEKTIVNAINSIINQKTDLHIELIIVDDGSSDSTEKKCKEIIVPESIIFNYHRTMNFGVSHARNIGIDLSNGKYVMFLDSDDELEVNACQVMYNSIINSNCCMVICGYNRVNGKKNIAKYNSRAQYERENYNLLIEELQSNNLFNQLWNKIYLTEVIKNNNIRFDERMSLGEDFRFILDYLRMSKNVLIIEDILYNYFITPKGLNSSYREDRLAINIENIKYLEDFYTDSNLSTNYIRRKYNLTIISAFSEIFIGRNRIKEKIESFCSNDLITNHLYPIDLKSKIFRWLVLKKNYVSLMALGNVLGAIKTIYKKQFLNY